MPPYHISWMMYSPFWILPGKIQDKSSVVVFVNSLMDYPYDYYWEQSLVDLKEDWYLFKKVIESKYRFDIYGKVHVEKWKWNVSHNNELIKSMASILVLMIILTAWWWQINLSISIPETFHSLFLEDDYYKKMKDESYSIVELLFVPRLNHM